MFYSIRYSCKIRKYCEVDFIEPFSGVELKFTEPLDSCYPETLWQIFPFKGDEEYGK